MSVFLTIQIYTANGRTMIMKKAFKITMIIITVLSAVISVMAAADYCRRKYRKSYIRV